MYYRQDLCILSFSGEGIDVCTIIANASICAYKNARMTYTTLHLSDNRYQVSNTQGNVLYTAIIRVYQVVYLVCINSSLFEISKYQVSMSEVVIVNQTLQLIRECTQLLTNTCTAVLLWYVPQVYLWYLNTQSCLSFAINTNVHSSAILQ